MRDLDWSASPLGDPEGWPQSLRTAVTMMLNTLQPMFIAWGPKLGFIYNEAYAPVLGAKHPAAMGRPFQEVWPDIWHDLSPLVDEALAGRPVWQEDRLLVMHRNGFPEETYFTFTYSPLHDEAGDVAGMFCTCIETTSSVTAERQLRETAAALAASEERYRGLGEQLFSLFEEAPGFVAALEGAEHRFLLVNAAYRQLIGHRDVIGRPVREALPELEGAGFFEILDDVFRTGTPHVGRGVRARLQRTPDAAPEDRYVDFIYQPVRDDRGVITGILVQGSDVTDREVFLAKQQLLLNELNHRVKNNLATVQSIAAQTARRATDVRSFVRDFEGRLISLAKTHDVLTRNAWEGAALEELLRRELEAFADQVRYSGPAIRLTSNQALALGLVLHELATNATKYGALSSPSGVVDIDWSVEDDHFVLCWAERDGPAVTPPTRRGFGSTLMEKMARGDLAGSVDLDYRPEGLRFCLKAPLADEAGPNPTARA